MTSYVTDGMTIVIRDEFAELLPEQSDDELIKLNDSIKQDGVRDPIVLWKQADGRFVIVDGHTRYGIAKELGIPVPYVVREFEDDDAVKVFIIVTQLARRNITKLDKHLLAVDLMHLEEERSHKRMLMGIKLPEGVEHGRTADIIARRLHDPDVTSRGIQRTKVIVERGVPEVKEALVKGKLSQALAVDLARLPNDTQRDILNRATIDGNINKQAVAVNVRVASLAPRITCVPQPERDAVSEAVRLNTLLLIDHLHQLISWMKDGSLYCPIHGQECPDGCEFVDAIARRDVDKVNVFREVARRNLPRV